ncbi:MAG: MBOAT family O-acyltransferase, partial [bacterium]
DHRSVLQAPTMLSIVLAILAAAVPYWLLPATWRREVLTIVSLVVLTWIDWRVGLMLVGATLAVVALTRGGAARNLTALVVLIGTALLFVVNKLAGGNAVLPGQSGVALLGTSFLVLKVAAVALDARQGATTSAPPRALAAWLAFLPTYTAGPIEDVDHFCSQQPRFDRARCLGGLERILFGLVKALLVATYLGQWSDPVLKDASAHAVWARWAAVYGATLRIYFDFAGYSDIAIGLGAVYGYDIAENFDRPLQRRNLVLLWQHWHMTLTRWLRTYLFVPSMRAARRRGISTTAAAVVGQLVAMTACGLWHGLSPAFALWGFLQALGLIWVGLVARPLGARTLPAVWLGWWRSSAVAALASTVLTVTLFALSNLLLYRDMRGAVAYIVGLHPW